MNIIQYLLPDNCYNKAEVKKTIILVHHTAGNASPFITVDGWKAKANKVATAYVIAGKPYSGTGKTWNDGDVIQCFDDQYWAYHLGLTPAHFAMKQLTYKELNPPAVAIEMCNWGPLTQDAQGNFKNYVGGGVPKEEAVMLPQPYKGFTYYHKYTDAQLISLKELLQTLCVKYNIPSTYNGDAMFDQNKDALSGKSGIWTHTSYRPDKSDCSPQENLIEVLKNL